jgi:hypothetical protein
MRRRIISCYRALLLAGAIGMAQSVSAADNTLAAAKELYASAAYDEALAILDRLKGGAPPGELTAIAEYRAFCLLALDRRDEARQSIESILLDNPFYQPSAEQASPRIQSVFRDVRRQALPTIVMARYTAAKAAFERKDASSERQFTQVLELLDDPDLQGAATLKDLRTVVAAFADLAKALSTAPVKAEAEKPAAVPAQPAPAAAPPPPLPDAVYTSSDSGVIAPVAQSQRMPPWVPPRNEADRQFNGALEVLIDETGDVVSAAFRTSVHPAYDPLLLKATRSWKFTPARRQGVPVRYMKVIDIRLTSVGRRP